MKSCPLFSAKLILNFSLCAWSALVSGQQQADIGFSAAANDDNPLFAANMSSPTHDPVINGNSRKIYGGNSGSTRPVDFANGYVVPLVFHIISQNPAAISDQQIIDAVKDLNDAFAHTGVYAAGPGANTDIEFCLARVDPDGGISNGITRTVSDLGDFDQDIEEGRLKNLGSWDTKQYCNIWFVDGIESEILPSFACGAWTRLHEAGYSALSGTGDYKDGIVTTAFGTLLAHEMGHYLGLSHIFALRNCQNNDCSVDGDGVCDTPPQSVVGGSCSAPQNSCSSDTLSGFNRDVPDLNSNFMSYSGSCVNEFTQGQAVKMRNNLATVRSSLLTQNKCTPPCTENMIAGFTRDNWFPSIGSNIHFTSVSTGGSNYQWSVDGVAAGSNSPDYSQIFAAAGKYKVTLKIFNANVNCYSSYSDFVIVGCGVMARFYPDKRIIATQSPFNLDHILFTNRSKNASSYKWLMSNNQGMAEQVVSSSVDLDFSFIQPANYSVRLVASNGSCSDTSEKFNFTVLDATPDGFPNIVDIQCYHATQVRVTLNVCNNGYGAIFPNMPLSFYDADPRSGHANKLATVLMPDTVPGKCCGPPHTYILDLHKPGQNLIYAVLNDDGITVPLVLPNASNKQQETNYADNISFKEDFQFKVSAIPPVATLEPGDTLQLIAQGIPGSIASAIWSDSAGLSCTDCLNPIFIAGKKDISKKLVAISGYGCADSAVSVIKIPAADDYTVTIDGMHCSGNDSVDANFTICNKFKRGIIPEGLQVSFYEGDPTTAGAHLIGPPFVTGMTASDKCASFSYTFKWAGAGAGAGQFFAVVNDSGVMIPPVELPEDTLFPEKDYSNNIYNRSYQPDTLSLQPTDTTVMVNTTLPITINSVVFNPASINWLPGDGYTLSCTGCPSPQATIKADALVRVNTVNQYGCTVSGKSQIKVVPPDMTLQLLRTDCFTNDSSLVHFTICMNNNYDSIFKDLPVSFYENDPSGGNGHLLGTFFVMQAVPGNCDSFSAVIKSPATGNLFAVVNDKGRNGNSSPDNSFPETNLTNNEDDTVVVPFRLTVYPADTTVTRLTPIQITADVTGGQISSINWQPADNLSCSDCLSPIVTPSHSLQYKIVVQNEYNCSATGYFSIKAYTTGNISIPNAFTPNGDGLNDVFFILGGQNIKMIRNFSVFNRWGQKIFEASNGQPNDPSSGWNGFVNGKQADAGAYVYIANIEFNDGHLEQVKGTVVLVR